MRKLVKYYSIKSTQPASRRFVMLLVLALCTVLSSCKSKPDLAITPTQDSGEMTPGPSSEITSEPEPLQTLTICIAEEPHSLYLYDGRQNEVKLNVLASIYDGPIDRVDSQLVPVILEAIPTLENGGVTLETVVVTPGQQVIDANGQIRAFREGVLVRPSGCQQSECAITWGGSGEFEMDVMVVTFTLLDGLKWSDGMTLDAGDSVFSYQLASDEITPGSRWAIDRTAEYQALDQNTVVWKGLPGFLTPDVDLFFWSPLPEHAWSDLDSTQLLEDFRSNKSPLGWGAYQVTSWIPGVQIDLDSNPYYFRSNEGLPFFDRLTYKFITDTDEALTALERGECDILDNSYHLEGRLSEILSGDLDQLFNTHITITAVWEGLTFGITPASYDDGYTAIYGDRLNYFGDSRTRQAFAFCIDRQLIVDEALLGMSEVPSGLMPNLVVSSDLQPISSSQDLDLGNQLLDQVGWKDVDLNPETPRQAWGINGIPSGTPFEIVLLTSPSIFHSSAAMVIKDSLADCGVQVSLETVPSKDLFAPGPDGPLFGRQFDLALFSWNATGRNDCGLYQSWQVPTKFNAWIGANLGGFSSPSFDQICNDTQLSLWGSNEATIASSNLQTAFENEWPVVPIANRINVLLSHVNLQGIAETSNSIGQFSNLESLFKTNP